MTCWLFEESKTCSSIPAMIKNNCASYLKRHTHRENTHGLFEDVVICSSHVNTGRTSLRAVPEGELKSPERFTKGLPLMGKANYSETLIVKKCPIGPMSQMACHIKTKRPLLHCSQNKHFGLVYCCYLWLGIPIRLTLSSFGLESLCTTYT